MNHKVDISEVNDFYEDLREVSADVQSSLDKVRESIEDLDDEVSFSGGAAKEARHYFNDLHGTILKSFKGLFDDLENNLNQHLTTFGTNVDADEDAVIRSNYLKEVKEDINEYFDKLSDEDEAIDEALEKVSEITSAATPSFSDVNDEKKNTVDVIKELDEDLSEFMGKGDETDVEELINQIEQAMNNAQTKDGEARFTNYKGNSKEPVLDKLKEYNRDKDDQEKQELASLSSDSELYLSQAEDDVKNEKIDKATYEAIKRGLIDGGDEFLVSLMKNRETNEIPSGDVENILEWGDSRSELFMDPKAILKKQKEISEHNDVGGYETEELWQINAKLNSYKQDKIDARDDSSVDVEKIEEKEKALRERFNDLSEYLIPKDEPVHRTPDEPLALKNGEELHFRIDGEGYVHYKAEDGYTYYQETDKQTKANQVHGIVGKTFSFAATSWLVGPYLSGSVVAQNTATGANSLIGPGSEILGNNPNNVLYVRSPGEVKTMIYRTDEETGDNERLGIDSDGYNIDGKNGWEEYGGW